MLACTRVPAEAVHPLVLVLIAPMVVFLRGVEVIPPVEEPAAAEVITQEITMVEADQAEAMVRVLQTLTLQLQTPTISGTLAPLRIHIMVRVQGMPTTSRHTRHITTNQTAMLIRVTEATKVRYN